MNLVLKQFRAEEGCMSFVVGDASSGKACIIDPRADYQDAYEAFLADRKLAAAFVVDTHTHADHYSGSHLVAEALGAQIAMSHATASQRAAVKLTQGAALELGPDCALETIETPGHTPDSISLVLKGGFGAVAFTGDTLLIGGSGRTDFPGADASAQYDSLHRKLAPDVLAAPTWVMPGHDYSMLLFSTMGHERRTNPHYLLTSREEFVKAKAAELLDAPCLLQNVVNFNLNARPRNSPRAGAITACMSACPPPPGKARRLSPDEFQESLARERAQGALFIDVREPEEFLRSRVEGVINVPMGELVTRWKDLASASTVYLMCDKGVRSLVAAETMRRLGGVSVADLAGGLAAWLVSGKPALTGS